MQLDQMQAQVRKSVVNNLKQMMNFLWFLDSKDRFVFSYQCGTVSVENTEPF